jgi:arginine exporter protein ArgO
MKLSLKQKALLQTVGLFALAIVTVVGVTLILEYVSTTVLLNLIGIGFFVWFGYMFYSVTLSRLEHQETWKKINEKFDNK